MPVKMISAGLDSRDGVWRMGGSKIFQCIMYRGMSRMNRFKGGGRIKTLSKYYEGSRESKGERNGDSSDKRSVAVPRKGCQQCRSGPGEDTKAVPGFIDLIHRIRLK